MAKKYEGKDKNGKPVILTAPEQKEVCENLLAKLQKKDESVKTLTAEQRDAALTKALKKKVRVANRAKTIPVFQKDGKLVLSKLGSGDFPATKAGKMAYCDFQILKWQEKKAAIAAKDDPISKTQAKIDKLTKQLELLKKEKQEQES